MTPPAVAAPVSSAAELAPAVREALGSLILTLADNKRILGIRYSDWMLGAPTIEAGIAASSMAQDEWGHGRLTYSLLSEFGSDPAHLEHERSPGEYHSMQALDEAFTSWTEFTAASLLLDTALSLQYGVLLDSRYVPVHNRVQKLLDEESYHFQHAAAWTRRLAAAPEVRGAFEAALARYLPAALRWFGPPGGEQSGVLEAAGVVHAGPEALRAHYLAQIGPVLAEAGLAETAGIRLGADDFWEYTPELQWEGWRDSTRRAGGDGPNEETIRRVRGDKNRALLLD